jgi:hypothetical protein
MSGDQSLRPSRIAAAIGIEKCPLVDVAVSEIDSVFRARCAQKFQTNLNAVVLRAEVLGVNAQGQNVYQSPAGRFLRTSESEVVTERSVEGQGMSRAAFLRANSEEELRACADGFVGQIMRGQKANWSDLQKFGRVVFGKEPGDGEMHRLQEAVEASTYRAFANKAKNGPNERAFKIATDFYYGLPVARMRTAESVFLQQYSTPLPMSVVAQRLVMGADDSKGRTILEPTAGNGGLVNLIPEGTKVYALELDRKRLDALRENPRIVAELGDATDVPFRARFTVPEGFDYTIANPPFGSMDEARSFDKLPSVRRLDHYIALRTLAARKDGGRSVLIFGADSAQSDGTVKGGAKSFLNYIHDHYEVHGLAELDGRMYTRHGAGYNVRLMVIGQKLAEARQASVPEKLSVLTTYDELWGWSEKVIGGYPKPAQEQRQAVERDGNFPGFTQLPNGNWVSNRTVDLGKLSVNRLDGLLRSVEVRPDDIDRLKDYKWMLLFDEQTCIDKGFMQSYAADGGPLHVMRNKSWLVNIDERIRVLGGDPQDLTNNDLVLNLKQPSVATTNPKAVEIDAAPIVGDTSPAFTTDANPPAVVVATPASTDAREPWQMTSDEWSEALARADRSRSVVGGRHPGGQQAEAIGEIARLKFEVTKWYQERAKAGDKEALEWINMPMAITHREVIAKAMAERHPVPGHVLAEYPELVAPEPERRVNEFQVPYQPASKAPMGSTAMIPINMAGAIYAALNDLEARNGPIDEFVAEKLRYPLKEILSGRYFDAAQIDALALGIEAVEHGRGVINADQTGFGKGRFVAGMMRYAKLRDQTPIFLTIKPELFTDIFRDIEDIGSKQLFNKLFIFNEGVHVMRFGTEDEILYRATSPQERRKATDDMDIDPTTDMVLATYSQFQRAATKNLKAQLLTAISQKQTMLFLDEAHVASGASNISGAVSEAVANTQGVLYSSATPLKGVSNFAIFNKVFPASVDLMSLPDTLRTGGEALQEAISANMARDGVLIRREHDFSKLTFVTRLPPVERQERNVELANKLAEVLAGLSYLAGDVSKVVGGLNKAYEADWAEIPGQERKGQRMRASSMNFGSRLYALNRQFLLGIKIEDAVQAALDALQAGRKPVIAVENTGESLLRQVLSRRAGVDALQSQLEELDERDGSLTEEDKRKREELQLAIGQALRDVRLDEPPQYRELLEIMLDRVGTIKVQGRYGDVRTERPSSEEYLDAEERLREIIKEFPDLPLTPLDVLRHELGKRGFPVAEVSGRTASLAMEDGRWAASFHPKADAVASVAGFQSGKYDAIIITRSGSTGISLHATDRFEDSDTRQRDFIVLQKASNIAEFLQWLGRVNRKDQVVEPVITSLDSGLPAELRLTMMHNAKLRKLSANTTSNRENANASGEEHDLLNEVGDSVALQWLFDNPDVADYLDITLPKGDDDELSAFSQDCPYINRLLGRLMMCDVKRQQEILDTLNRRFIDKIEELEQQGVNPFKVDVYEWGASVVKEEELQSGVLKPTGSTFDEAIKLVTVEFERDVFPIRSEKLLDLVRSGTALYRANAPLDDDGAIKPFLGVLYKLSEGALRAQLPAKLRESEMSVSEILVNNDLAAVQKAKEKQEFLVQNLPFFKPGAQLTHDDLFKGEVSGVVTAVDFPSNREDVFLLSKYTMRVAFPGEDKLKDLSLATLFNQGQTLTANSYRAIDLDRMERFAHVRAQAQRSLQAFDEAPDGKVKRRAHLLQGNIFRACELAAQQKLGSPILFTDADGNRQRAVLLKDRITPESVKSLPIGMDADDAAAYIEEYLRAGHKDHHARVSYGGLRIFDQGVKDMKKGEGVMLEVLNGGLDFRISVPGTKARAGKLLTDSMIFDIGEKTPEGSMKIELTGSRAFMKADISRKRLPELMRRLQVGGHVGKFYVADPDQEVLKTLKARNAQESQKRPVASSVPEPA